MKNFNLFLILFFILASYFVKSQTIMEIPSFIQTPTQENILIENVKTIFQDNKPIDDRRLFVKLNDKQIKFEDYLNNFDTYSSEKYKLSEYIINLPFEVNPELIIKGFEKLIENDKANNYLSDYAYSQFLKKIIKNQKYEKYTVEKVLSFLKEDKTNYKNANLYWHELYLLIYDYIPKTDWLKLIEKNNVLVYNEYYGYQGISRISSLYARNKGFSSINSYIDILNNWKNDLEKDYDGFHWNKFSKYEYSLYSIRSILEYSELTISEKKWIRNQLIDKNVFQMPGQIQPLVAICFYLCSEELFIEDFEKLFETHWQKDQYKKLLSLKKFDEENLLQNLFELDFITNTKKSNLGDESHMISDFPITDRAIWKANNKVLHFDAEFSQIPVNYDGIINSVFLLLDDKEFIFSTKTKAEKINNTYKYQIEIRTKEKIYKISPNDNNDYFDINSLHKILNFILFDTGRVERIIPIQTEDQSALFILTRPDKLLNLYKIYDLNLVIGN